MKKSLAVAGVLVVLAMLQTMAVSSLEQFRVGDMVHGLFINKTESQVTGLLLVFDGPAEIQNWMPIGGYMAPTPAVAGEIRFAGSLDPNGEVFIDWLADGPRLTRAAWLLNGEVVEDLCVACPSARMCIIPGQPYAGGKVTFRSLSQDPNNSALVHEWEWEDEVIAIGEVVTRTYATTGDHQVTLSARNAEGLTGQETRHFSISPEPEPRQYFTLSVTSLPMLRSPEDPESYPIGIRIYGPGIDYWYERATLYSPPTLLANDRSETYPAGTRVTLIAVGMYNMHFSQWLLCSSCSDNECTVIMDADRFVMAVFSDF